MISVKRLTKLKDAENKTKAMVTLDTGDFLLSGIRVVDAGKGPFVSMPQRKGTDGKYYDTIHPTSDRMKEDINNAVLAEFNK